MTLNYVTLVLDGYYPGGGNPAPLLNAGFAQLAPSAQLTDPGVQWTPPAPVQAVFRAAGGPPQAVLLATDNAGLQPSGWGWTATFEGVPGNPAPFSFFIPAGPVTFTATNASPAVFTWTPTAALTSLPNGTGVQLSGGSLPAGFTAGTTYYVVNASGSTVQLAAAQGGAALGSASTGSGSLTVVQYNLSAISPVSSVTTMAAYMPLPSGTPSSGQVPIATGSGEASAWGTTGAVLSVFGRTGSVTAQTGDYTPAQVGAVAKTGDTMSGPLNMAGNKITNIGPQRPVIWSDDASGDDFALTARILGYHQAMGDVNVLAVVVDTYSPATPKAQAMDALLRHEGIACPVGVVSATYSDITDDLPFMRNMSTIGGRADFHPVPDAAAVLRTALAGSASKVDLICTGHQSAMYALRQSAADGISPLTGDQLIAAKVNAVWVMGGDYPSGTEWNFSSNTLERVAAAGVFNTWNATFPGIPVTYMGFTVGNTPLIGDTLFTLAPADDPCRQELIDLGRTSQHPWDALLMRIACLGSPALAGYTTTQGQNNINSSTGTNTFTAGSGNQFYVSKSWTDAQIYADVEPLLILGSQPGRATRPTERGGIAVNRPAGTTYTLAISDAGRVIEGTGSSALTLTVPNITATPFAVGDQLDICQYGTGPVYVTGATGVIVRSRNGLASSARYGVMRLRKRADNEWVLSGDTTAGGPAVLLQQAGISQAPSGSSYSIPITTSAGSTLAVLVSGYMTANTSIALASVSDNAAGGSNTWTYSTAASNQNPPAAGGFSGQYGFSAIAACLPSANGGSPKAVTSVTVAFSTAPTSFIQILVLEFSNVSTTAAILGAASNGTPATVNTFATPAVTTTSNGLGLATGATAAGNWTTVSGGWNFLGVAPFTGIAWAYAPLATPGSVSCTFSGGSTQAVQSSATEVIG